MLSSIMLSGFLLVAVCTQDSYSTSGSSEQCYDTVFESTTVIRCDDNDWGREPYPWEFTRGRVTLGYIDSVTEQFVENYSFYYEWGGWDVLPFEQYKLVLGINSGPEGQLFASSMEGECHVTTTR